jgi:hypothetical protein
MRYEDHMEDPDYIAAVSRLGYCQRDLDLLYVKAHPVEKMRVALYEAWQEEKKKREARPKTPTGFEPEPSSEPQAEAETDPWNPTSGTPEPRALIEWDGLCESLFNYPRLMV